MPCQQSSHLLRCLLVQLHLLYRRRRTRSSTVVGHPCCRCPCSCRDSPTGIVCHRQSSLTWRPIGFSSPGPHASTACVNLDVFTSEGSGSSGGASPLSLVARDRVSGCSMKSGEDEQTDVSCELSRFQPLNPPASPVHISNPQIVVESPSHNEAPVMPVSVSELLDSVV